MEYTASEEKLRGLRQEVAFLEANNRHLQEQLAEVGAEASTCCMIARCSVWVGAPLACVQWVGSYRTGMQKGCALKVLYVIVLTTCDRVSACRQCVRRWTAAATTSPCWHSRAPTA